MIVLVDWLSVTFKNQVVNNDYDLVLNSIKNILGLPYNLPFQDTKGMYGFAKRIAYDGINIHYDRDDKLIWLEMSGQGCRNFESYGHGDWLKLFDYINQDDCNVTRIDIAIDDKEGILKLKRLANDTLNQKYVSKFEFYDVRQSSKGITIYHGSPQSDVRIRIYDKALERGYDEATHWVRFEIQMRRKRAINYIRAVLNNGDIGYITTGVINSYIRYIKLDNVRKTRCSTVAYWRNFISHTDKISIFSKVGTEYNLHQLEEYVYKQCGNAIDTLYKIKGGVGFWHELRTNKPENINPKYEELISRMNK